MSKRYLLAGLGLLALATALALPGLAQPRSGGPGGPFGPTGPWMIGPGYGPNAAGGPQTIDGAVEQARNALRAWSTGDLVVGEVMEFSNHFYVVVKERGTVRGAFALIVERTGFVHPEPGPNMLWNTKYGRMAGFRGGMMGYGHGPGWQGWAGSPGTPAPTLSIERAREIAVQYLFTTLPGATPDQGMAFYGFFTFDVDREGKPFGMLSVNAFTGQVWYHTWHGTFIQEKAF